MSKTVGVVLSLKDKFSGNLKNVALQLNTTEAKLKKANLQIKKFEGNMTKGFKNASLAVVGVGSAITGAIGVATNATLSYAKEVKQMQRLTGASVEEASKMVVVGKRYGVTADMMAKSIRMLGIKATNGSKDFKKYGLTVKDSHGQLLPATKILENVADKYKQLGGGLKGAVFAQKIMGKSAMQMIPLLEKGSAGVRDMYEQAEKMGLVLSKDNMTAFAKFAQVQKNFNQAMLGIQVSIGTKVLPYLSLLADKVQVVIKQIDFRQVGLYTTLALNAIGNAVVFVSKNLNWIIPIVTGVVGAMATFKTVTFVLALYKEWVTLTKALAITQGVLNAVLIANPIGLIVVGVGALVGLGVALYMNWDKVVKVLAKAWGFLTKIAKVAWNNSPVGMAVNAVKGAKNGVKKHNALGTNYFSGGSTWVGENGPEIIDNIPPGARIHSANKSQKIATGGNNGGVTVIIQGDFIGTKEMYNKFKTMLANEFKAKAVTA